MLTRADLDALVARSEITPWRPGQAVQIGHRDFYATPEAAAALSGPWTQLPGESLSGMRNRRLRLYALVARWISGDAIVPVEELKPLTPPPPGIWEFRTNYPKPGSRLVGLVPYRNAFVATGVYLRSLLGSAESAEWSLVCTHARAKWNGWYPHCEPLVHAGAPILTESDARRFWDDR